MNTHKASASLRILFLQVITGINILYSCNGVGHDNLKKDYSSEISHANLKTEIRVDLKALLKTDNDAEAVTVPVKYDHYFKKPKKYKGFLINPILDSIVKVNGFNTGNAVIVFDCIDGYKPVMDFSKFYGSTKAYIAYKDVSMEMKTNWPDSLRAKFEPYYLVWNDVPKEDHSFAWPFGLTGFTILSMAAGHENIYPYKNLSFKKGFILFKDNCLKCHSVNKSGGSMGPELNFPKNITEYWNERDIISFVKKPVSYRFNSRMPAITNLSDAEFKEIVLYLKYMKDNKVYQ